MVFGLCGFSILRNHPVNMGSHYMWAAFSVSEICWRFFAWAYCAEEVQMRNRGSKFWQWADSCIHSRTHEEELADGTVIDVQVRLSPVGCTQLFLGVYAYDGSLLIEEVYGTRPGETMSMAMQWGLERARAVAVNGPEMLFHGGNAAAGRLRAAGR